MCIGGEEGTPSHLLVEGGPRRPGGLLPELRQHQRLAQFGAGVHVRVDPAPREAQAGFLGAAAAARQPGVGPQVGGREVDLGHGVVAHEVAAEREGVVGVVRQELCTAKTGPLSKTLSRIVRVSYRLSAGNSARSQTRRFVRSVPAALHSCWVLRVARPGTRMQQAQATLAILVHKLSPQLACEGMCGPSRRSSMCREDGCT